MSFVYRLVWPRVKGVNWTYDFLKKLRVKMARITMVWKSSVQSSHAFINHNIVIGTQDFPGDRLNFVKNKRCKFYGIVEET